MCVKCNALDGLESLLGGETIRLPVKMKGENHQRQMGLEIEVEHLNYLDGFANSKKSNPLELTS